MFLIRFIQLCGRHPFVTGLFSLIGLFGLVFSFFSFSVDRAEARSSQEQAERIYSSIEGIKKDLLGEPGPRVPVIFGKSYPDARKDLIENGWMPKRNHPSVLRDMGKYNGNATYLWDAGFWENEHCFPTGDAACLFRFHDKDGNTLMVATAGEASPTDLRHVVVTGAILNPENGTK